MNSAKPDLSVVILSYNGRRDLEALIDSIDRQTLSPELVIIDSGSSDGTHEFLKSRRLKFYTIPTEQFNHGATRNYGMELSTCEIVVFVTQDVVFDNTDSLELLIQPFSKDQQIAMSYGRQLPKPDATVLSEFARLNNYPAQSIVKSIQNTSYLGIKNCHISNSFAAYRKTQLLQLGGFPTHLIMCEDVFAGGSALLKGWRIAYVAEARVFHSHNYTIWQEFERYFDIGFFYNSESWILKNFSKAEAEGLSYLRKELGFIWKKKKALLIPEFLIRSTLKYAGYKLGQYQHLIPKRLKRKISMHAYHWKGNQPTEGTSQPA